MKTFFASPKRSNPEELYRQIQSITHNKLVDAVMRLVGGLIAVLNKDRQIVAVNYYLLDLLGVKDPEEVLGLRPGEALGCAFANEMEAGCGTGTYCASCGAAVAIVSSQIVDGPVERDCAMVVERNDRLQDLFFHVMASPIEIQQEQFVLIFLHDRTQQQYQASLERTFFHDIRNTISGLLNASELLALASPEDSKEMAGHIISLSGRLNREVELQIHLSQMGQDGVEVDLRPLPVGRVLEETRDVLSHHPSNMGIGIVIEDRAPGAFVRTDLSLLIRALTNMLINACEASDAQCDVIFRAEHHGEEIVFSVWNNQCIPKSFRNRIFQRNFSTKEDIGRGLGTFSMKLIAEQLLGGSVYFESSRDDGTWFHICLPEGRETG